VKFKGGIAEKEGITFAVVQVGRDVLDVPGRARDLIPQLQEIFPDMNVVLMTRGKHNAPIFYGRPDIVNGLGDVALRHVEWKQYTLKLPDRDDD